MGLNTSHGAYNGSYSTFGELRHWLAGQIGINLNDYAGYRNINATKDLTTINHELMPLFNHSDCSGELTPKECEQIAIGLDKVLASAIKDDGPFSNWQLAKQFMDGCQLAASQNEPIYFH